MAKTAVYGCCLLSSFFRYQQSFITSTSVALVRMLVALTYPFYTLILLPSICKVSSTFCVFCGCQEDTPDSIKLLEDPKEAVVNALASELGLQRVGWIFTDLVADDVRIGTVKHLRDINTHFLTAEECILAGQLQNQHPSSCKFSSSGKFGSKFATVVVSGIECSL